MPKKLEKPTGASSLWKSLLAGFSTSVLFVFMIWLFDGVFHQYTGGTFIRPLTTWEILLGSIGVLFGVWSYWAWRPRRRHASWHRWLQACAGVLYISILMLILAVSYWSAILRHPWNWAINGILITFFAVAWGLPLLSYQLAKKLSNWQWELNMRLSLLGLGGIMVTAGILGSSFGRYAAQNGGMEEAMSVIALFSSLIALTIAQMGAKFMWDHRPWAKEEE